jgi:hypothetical protein
LPERLLLFVRGQAKCISHVTPASGQNGCSAIFIPSDHSADYRQIALGSNRNFELRREFAAYLHAAPIPVTSVLNGAFADMLTSTAPLIAFGRRKVMYWSSADQILDFTTKDDVARVVALVTLDADAVPSKFIPVVGSTRLLAGSSVETPR